jgi:hypothetical protein
MACNCGSGACSCLIQAGDGIVVTGSGTPTNPYVVQSKVLNLVGALTVRDSDSVDLTLWGSGTTTDPFTLTASSSLKLTQLSDVADPSGGPSVGESPVWIGTGADGHWEFSTLPPSPAGSVNAGSGVGGLGTVADPLFLEAAAVWGTGELAGLGPDSTIGLPVYIDSAGKVRAKPVDTTVAWAAITGKPATFTPSAHHHLASDIDDPLNLSVGKIRAKSIDTTATSTTPPSSPTALGLWFFPKGS